MTIQSNLDLVWALNAGIGVADPGDTKYTSGWEVEIPTHEHFNFVLQNNSKNILTLAEQGSHNWQEEISYKAGARVIGSDSKFYTCKTDSVGTSITGEDPTLDVDNTFWMSGLLIGNDLPSNALAVRGMHVKDINTRATATSWDGNDITLESKCPIIAMNVEGASKNWAIANVTGELVAIDADTAVLPDDGSIALAEARVHRLYHEGHPPEQSEVAGTIPEAPADGNYYGRRNNSWNELGVFPTGTLMLFQQTAAPTGWTKQLTHNNKSLRVVTGTAGSGGANSFTTIFGTGKVTGGHAITTTEMPVHNHTATFSGIALPNHNHTVSAGLNSTGGTGRMDIDGNNASLDWTFATSSNSAGTPEGSVTVNNRGSSASHDHTLSLNVQYVDLIIASKD